MNFVANLMPSTPQLLKNISRGALSLCKTSPSEIFSKITTCFKAVLSSSLPVTKSVWSYSFLSIIRFSLPAQRGVFGVSLDVLCGLSGLASVFYIGRKGLELYGAFSGGVLIEYLSENLLPHCHNGFVFDRKAFWFASLGIHAVVVPTLMLQIKTLDTQNSFADTCRLYRLTGISSLLAIFIRKMEELGQTFSQKQIIENSEGENRKILIVEAEADHNGGLFPNDRFLGMLEALSKTCKMKHIIVKSSRDLQEKTKEFLQEDFSIIWFRTHSWGYNETLGEGLFFSQDFSVDRGDQLLCLQSLGKKKFKIVLEGCSLAKRKNCDTLSFAENVSKALHVEVYSSSFPVIHPEIIWSEEDFNIRLLDEENRDITKLISFEENN